MQGKSHNMRRVLSRRLSLRKPAPHEHGKPPQGFQAGLAFKRRVMTVWLLEATMSPMVKTQRAWCGKRRRKPRACARGLLSKTPSSAMAKYQTRTSEGRTRSDFCALVGGIRSTSIFRRILVPQNNEQTPAWPAPGSIDVGRILLCDGTVHRQGVHCSTLDIGAPAN